MFMTYMKGLCTNINIIVELGSQRKPQEDEHGGFPNILKGLLLLILVQAVAPRKWLPVVESLL